MGKKLLITLAALVLIGGGVFFWLNANKAQALTVGSTAPSFSTKGALAGQPFDLNLDEQLKKGPLVLYFFPKVFTAGCTAEAHEFAERSADFAAQGAAVVGMSGDDLDGLSKFSKEACRDKFAVAQASPDIIKDYGVQMAPGMVMTNRTSFVIGQDHKVKFVFSNLDYKDHVRKTLQAVKDLKAEAG